MPNMASKSFVLNHSSALFSNMLSHAAVSKVIILLNHNRKLKVANHKEDISFKHIAHCTLHRHTKGSDYLIPKRFDDNSLRFSKLSFCSITTENSNEPIIKKTFYLYFKLIAQAR